MKQIQVLASMMSERDRYVEQECFSLARDMQRMINKVILTNREMLTYYKFLDRKTNNEQKIAESVNI